MTIERFDAHDAIELTVRGELDIHAVADACALLTRTLSARRDLRIDLSRVSGLDSAGVQILLAARRAAEHGGCRFELVSPSAEVREVMELLQLGALFGAGPVEHGACATCST